MTTNKRFKRILALLLAAALCFSNMLSPALSAFAAAIDGSGTSNDPYVLILGETDYNTWSLNNVKEIEDTRNASTNNSSSVVNYSLSGSGSSKTLTVTANKTGTAEIEYEQTSGGDKTVYFTVVSLADTIYLEVGESENITFSTKNLNVTSLNTEGTNAASITKVNSSSSSNSTTFTVEGTSEGTMYVSYGTVIYKVIVTQPTTYSVTYDENGGTEVADASNVVANTQVNLPTTTRTGYHFDGWSDGTTLYTGNTYTVTGNVILTAQWTANTYEIAYNLNDDGDSTTSNTNPATYTYGTGLSLVNATRTGYDFLGWYVGETKVTNITTTDIDEIELTAKWSLSQYSIGYDLNGGSLADGQSNAVSYNMKSDAITLINPTKTGSTFSGWTSTTFSITEGTKVVIPQGTTGDLSFTATWNEIPYTVNFSSGNVATNNIDSGKWADNASSSTKYYLNEYPISTYIPEDTTGQYTFTGWVVTEDGNNASVTVSDKSGYYGAFTMPASNVTITAQWKTSTFTVNYDANGGEGSMDASSGDWDTTVILSANSFTKENYHFLGWADTNDATTPDFTADAIKDGTAKIENIKANVTLYAVWAVDTYDVTYDEGGVTVSDLPEGLENVAVGATFTIAATTLEGGSNVKFDGWKVTYVDKNGVTQNVTVTLATGQDATTYGAFTMPAGKVTIEAQWVGLYTISYSAGEAESFTSTEPTYAGGAQESGNQITVNPGTPTATGYVFDAWVVYDANGNEVSSNKVGQGGIQFTMPDSHVTITATWTPIEYTVTYYHDHAYEYDVLENNGEGAFADVYAAYTTQQSAGHQGGSQTVAGYYTYTDNSANVFADYFNASQGVDYKQTINASLFNTAAVTASANFSMNTSNTTDYAFVDWTVYDVNGNVLEVGDVTYANVDTATLEALEVTQNLIVVANFAAQNANFYYNSLDAANDPNYLGDHFTRSDITVIDYYDEYSFYNDDVSNSDKGTVISWSVADGKLSFDNLTVGTAYITISSNAGIETFSIEVEKAYTVEYAVADGETFTSVPTKQENVRVDTEIEITAADPTKTGYTFAGWQVSYTVEGVTYTAEVTEGEGDANDTFTMPAANVTITATWEKDLSQWLAITPEDYEVVYDATAYGVKVSVGNLDEDDEENLAEEKYTLTYSDAVDGEYTDEAPTFTDVGTYTVYVKVTAEDYVDAAPVSATVTITQAPLTVTVEDADKTADESDPSYSASVVGLVSTSHGVSFYLSREAGDAVGTYEITAFDAIVKAFSTNELDETTFVDVTANYEINYVSGILTINAAPVVEEDDDDDTTTTTTTTTTTPTITEVTIEPEVVEVAPAATTPAATTTEEPEAEAEVEEAPVEIEETEVPLASAEDEGSTEIEDTEVPLVATATTTGWALLNLILAIGTVATSIIMLVSYFLNRRDDEEAASGNENLKVLSVLPAAIAAAFFMLTSDMSSAMSFVDKWTLAMALIAIIQLAIVVVSGKGKNTTTGDEFV